MVSLNGDAIQMTSLDQIATNVYRARREARRAAALQNEAGGGQSRYRRDVAEQIAEMRKAAGKSSRQCGSGDDLGAQACRIDRDLLEEKQGTTERALDFVRKCLDPEPSK